MNNKAYNNQKSNESNARKRLRGIELSKDIPTEKEKIEYDNNAEINIVIDYSGELSKNVILGRGNFGSRVFMKKSATIRREEIAYLCKQEMLKNKVSFVEGKVWLDILVQKPTAGSGDALNVLDLIADAVQDGIGINDKWFCVKSIDWEIKKENPKIFIQVLQEVKEAHRICSYCGGIRTISNFKPTKNGYSRYCAVCRGKSKA